MRDRAHQAELIPKFLAISLAGFTIYGVSMVLVLVASRHWPDLRSVQDALDHHVSLIHFEPDAGGSIWTHAFDGSALTLILAYNIGLIAASGVCLPSCYFYGLLSGIKVSMVDVTIQTLKAKASTAIFLIGVLPVYVAIMLGMLVFSAPDGVVLELIYLGLLLPFAAGFWGLQSLYFGLTGLCDTISAERRPRRECFLRRLVLSWSAVYAAVSPIMIYTLWERLGR